MFLDVRFSRDKNNYFRCFYVEERLANTGLLPEVRLTHTSWKELDPTKIVANHSGSV